MNTVRNITSILMLILLSWLVADLIAAQLRRRNNIIEYRQTPALP